MAERTNDPRYGDRDRHDDRFRPEERPRVAPLSDLGDFKIAENEPDIRGWKVRSSDNKEIGKVKDLIADTGAMKIRYLDVSLDKKRLNLKDDRRVLVPIGAARLIDDDDVVLINRPASDFVALPAYDGTFDRSYEDRMRSSWGATTGATAGATPGSSGSDYYDQEHFNDREFFGRRRQGREDANYLTRSEEELTVGKRTRQAGEVDVHKHVETERVSQSVPVQREEVTVERRPLSGGEGPTELKEDEIRVPLMAEEPVVEKRTVPKEEVIIKKHAVQDEQRVEADVKKERLDVDKKGAVDEDRSRRR